MKHGSLSHIIIQIILWIFAIEIIFAFTPPNLGLIIVVCAFIVMFCFELLRTKEDKVKK